MRVELILQKRRQTLCPMGSDYKPRLMSPKKHPATYAHSVELVPQDCNVKDKHSALLIILQ